MVVFLIISPFLDITDMIYHNNAKRICTISSEKILQIWELYAIELRL